MMRIGMRKINVGTFQRPQMSGWRMGPAGRGVISVPVALGREGMAWLSLTPPSGVLAR